MTTDKPPLPFLLPSGVSYDGVWHSTNSTYLFTDRAVTMSTFAIRAHELSRERVDRELAKMRADFAAAARGESPESKCACDSGHGCGIAPHICGCPECEAALSLSPSLSPL